MTYILFEKPVDPAETYRLAETTDLLYRKLKNVGLSRRYADTILPDEHSAMQLAAIRIIKSTPPGEHPVRFINKRNLAVLRVVTTSLKRAVCLGSEGRVYPAMRGHVFPDGKFIPSAPRLPVGFALYSSKNKSDHMKLNRIATLKPSAAYLN